MGWAVDRVCSGAGGGEGGLSDQIKETKTIDTSLRMLKKDLKEEGVANLSFGKVSCSPVDAGFE